MLAEAYTWITRRGWALTIILVVIWPILSIPAGKFTKGYFTFWVLLSIAWGFGAAIVITILPVQESSDELMAVVNGLLGKSAPAPAPAPAEKTLEAEEFDDDAAKA